MRRGDLVMPSSLLHIGPYIFLHELQDCSILLSLDGKHSVNVVSSTIKPTDLNMLTAGTELAGKLK